MDKSGDNWYVWAIPTNGDPGQPVTGPFSRQQAHLERSKLERENDASMNYVRATVSGRKLIGFGPSGPHTHRHKKGGLYTKLMEAVHSETEEPMVVYQGEDGRTWVRPKAMFEEPGRFEPVVQSDG